MISIATQAASRSRLTSEISAAAIISLSATGSMTLPKLVTAWRERAMYPSSPSVSAAIANTTAAIVEPPGVSTVSATTTTGTSRMRTRVSALGRLSGNKPGSGYPAPPRQILDSDAAADRAERRDGRGEQRPGEGAAPRAVCNEQAEPDPAESM